MKKPKPNPTKVKTVLGEFKAGKLHSGSDKGPKVTSRDQALAIAINEGIKASRGTKK